MKTTKAGGAEALGGCARTVRWAIAFHFVTSFTCGVSGAASATFAVLLVTPAPTAMTRPSTPAARTRPVQAERRVLIGVMTHLLLDAVGFVRPRSSVRFAGRVPVESEVVQADPAPYLSSPRRRPR